MKCKILHSSAGRLRVHMEQSRPMTLYEAECLETYLRELPFVREAKVYDRTCDAVIRYREGEKAALCRALGRYSVERAEASGLEVNTASRELSRDFESNLLRITCWRYFKKLALPFRLRHSLTVLGSLRYLSEGIRSLLRGKLEVAVLDATAITAASFMSFLRR